MAKRSWWNQFAVLPALLIVERTRLWLGWSSTLANVAQLTPVRSEAFIKNTLIHVPLR